MSDSYEHGPESRTAYDDGIGSDEDSAGADGVGVREGLPQSYRMRADRHYVEQLGTPSGAQPVRMVPLAQIECGAPVRQLELRPLIESIRTHGILHPLIVRRQGPRYVVVAGRKRFVAAQMLRLAAAPCLVHDLDETGAAAIRAADDLRIGPAERDVPNRVDLGAAHRLIARHLATVRSWATLPLDAGDGLERPAFELLEAHAWRASQLLACLDLLTDAPCPPARPRSRAVAAIVDDVIEGFAPETGLGGVSVRADVAPGLSASGLDEGQLAAGIAGGVLATLPLVAAASRPVLLIRAAGVEPGGIAFEFVQQDAPIPPRLARAFFDNDPAASRAGGYAAALGALAARALAERHGGRATFEALSPGSRLSVTLLRRS